MSPISGPAILAFALLIGILAGFYVRRAQLCTFAAIETLLFGGDTRRIRAFAIALAVAIGITQTLIVTGYLNVDTTSYLSAGVSGLAATLGGFLFGLGMALVGTCAFGCLIRLGGGDLRSLIAIILIGAVAFASVFGTLAAARIFLQYNLPFAPSVPADLPAVLERAGISQMRSWAAALIAGGLLLWALADRRLWAARRLLVAGVALGLLIPAGWIVTGVLPDPFLSGQTPESLTFVVPLAKATFGALYREESLAAFSTLSAVGVVIGSFIAARLARDFRWEAFDAHQEMQRHLLGASLMGFGGAVAGGCTIGQGLTAGSVLASNWPFAVGGITLGAWLGTFMLIGGWCATRRWIRARLWGGVSPTP